MGGDIFKLLNGRNLLSRILLRLAGFLLVGDGVLRGDGEKQGSAEGKQRQEAAPGALGRPSFNFLR